ncbi:unnamed protein product [Owenia fusiformis]|uniref:C2H2-type domain-containing protein n=1 Tax=Owenia fusiformis TaxID=6347 RepID=A0A8S4QFL5_OWEFU|nr:unnamed protein product [Owenia fusiformis]
MPPFQCMHCPESLSIDSVIEHYNNHSQTTILPVNFYQCSICSFHTRHSKSFIDHVSEYHKSTELFHCPYCDAQAPTAEILVSHMEVYKYLNGAQLLYKCADCKQQLETKRSLKRHILRDHNDSYLCGFCSEKFKTLDEMCTHIDANIYDIYKCKECSFVHTSQANIEQHVLINHVLAECIVIRKSVPGKCLNQLTLSKLIDARNEVMKQDSKDLKKQHVSKKSTTKGCKRPPSLTVACNMCGDHIDVLQVDEHAVICKKTKADDVSGAQSTTDPKSESHSEGKCGITNRPKDVCVKVEPFENYDLNGKMMWYECAGCKFETKNSLLIVSHLGSCNQAREAAITLTADGCRPPLNASPRRQICYTCPNCPYDAYSSVEMCEHMQNHAKRISLYTSSQFSCSYCNQIFQWYYELYDHMSAHKGRTKLKLFTCQLCRYRTTLDALAKDHALQVHEQRLDPIPLVSMFECQDGSCESCGRLLKAKAICAVCQTVRCTDQPQQQINSISQAQQPQIKSEHASFQNDTPAQNIVSGSSGNLTKQMSSGMTTLNIKCPLCVMRFPSHHELQNHNQQVHDIKFSISNKPIKEEQDRTRPQTYACNIPDTKHLIQPVQPQLQDASMTQSKNPIQHNPSQPSQLKCIIKDEQHDTMEMKSKLADKKTTLDLKIQDKEVSNPIKKEKIKSGNKAPGISENNLDTKDLQKCSHPRRNSSKASTPPLSNDDATDEVCESNWGEDSEPVDDWEEERSMGTSRVLRPRKKIKSYNEELLSEGSTEQENISNHAAVDKSNQKVKDKGSSKPSKKPEKLELTGKKSKDPPFVDLNTSNVLKRSVTSKRKDGHQTSPTVDLDTSNVLKHSVRSKQKDGHKTTPAAPNITSTTPSSSVIAPKQSGMTVEKLTSIINEGCKSNRPVSTNILKSGDVSKEHRSSCSLDSNKNDVETPDTHNDDKPELETDDEICVLPLTKNGDFMIPKEKVFSSHVQCSDCSFRSRIQSSLVHHLQQEHVKKETPRKMPAIRYLSNCSKRREKGEVRVAKVLPKVEKHHYKHGDHFETKISIQPEDIFSACETGKSSRHCRQCNFSGKSTKELRLHRYLKHILKKHFFCIYCGLKAESEKVIKSHCKKVHKSLPVEHKILPADMDPKPELCLSLVDDIGNKSNIHHGESLRTSITGRKVAEIVSGSADDFTVLARGNDVGKLVGKLVGKFKCNVCNSGSTYTSKEEAGKHINRSHLGINNYTCTQCNTQFQKKNDCEHHCISKHKSDKYVKSNKPPVFRVVKVEGGISYLGTDIEDDPKEVTNVDSRETIFCGLCNKSDKEEDVIKKHILDKHVRFLPFICTICNQSLYNRESAEAHCKHRHEGKDHKKCIATVVAPNIDHTIKEIKGKIYIGDVALTQPTKPVIRTLPDQKTNKDHARLPINTKANTKSVTEIQKSGTEPKKAEKPIQPNEEFQCNVCKKQYLNKHTINMHIYTTHKTSERFFCKLCDVKAMCTRDEIKEHILNVHRNTAPLNIGVKPLPTLKYTKSGSLTIVTPELTNTDDSPAQTAEDIRKFRCGLCHVDSKNKYETKKHVYSVHLKLGGYYCKLCNDQFYKVNEAKEHVKLKHAKSSIEKYIGYHTLPELLETNTSKYTIFTPPSDVPSSHSKTAMDASSSTSDVSSKCPKIHVKGKDKDEKMDSKRKRKLPTTSEKGISSKSEAKRRK